MSEKYTKIDNDTLEVEAITIRRMSKEQLLKDKQHADEYVRNAQNEVVYQMTQLAKINTMLGILNGDKL